MAPHRLTLVIPTLDRSGAEKQFCLLAAGLPRDEFAPEAVVLTRTGPYEDLLHAADVPVSVLGKRHKADPVCLRRLQRLLRTNPPAIVHSWLFAANAYARLAVSRRQRPKVIVSERCVDSWKANWQHWLDRRQMPQTDRLVANSQPVADYYAERGFPRERIVVIPNGIEVPEETPLDRANILREFGIPETAFVIGYVGRLAPQKRVQDLIWAMELLKQLNDTVYFLVIGDGPDLPKLQQLARDVHCDDRVVFAGHRGDIEQLLPVLTTFWIASDFEGMSNSVMEAMAAGVPVVASDIPANAELVSHGETGYLVRVGDCVGLMQFTQRLLHDQDLRDRLGRAGQTKMRENFSVKLMVDRHVDLYRELVRSTPAGSDPQLALAR